MYKLFYQLDNERKVEEEKQQGRSLFSEQNRRDSFSTISTHETEIVISTTSVLPLVTTWGEFNLPMEIAVPDHAPGKSFIGHSIRSIPHHSLVDDGEGATPVLPTALLVDDDEDLNLIFTDSHDDDTHQYKDKPQGLLTSGLSLESSSHDSDTIDPLEPYIRQPSLVTVESLDDDDLIRFELEGFTRFEI